MAGPAERAPETVPVEIIAPTRLSCRGTVICDCCRQMKSNDDFDEDALGICLECLGTDVLLVDLVPRV
ncbi:hypothetical protein HJB99_32515 [Rhizobium sp. NLR17b]|uniref:hypothetical protein n=1 Tax=Rhizobium sp. NLR17b TaxID=2731114 RepID=UPI001C839719|nr:hypothetical protein [Rhizobium sp. NLR17b]MBX5273309.1 hypothetical protein [Rhizobium sp. NLR17b]